MNPSGPDRAEMDTTNSPQMPPLNMGFPSLQPPPPPMSGFMPMPPQSSGFMPMPPNMNVPQRMGDAEHAGHVRDGLEPTISRKEVDEYNDDSDRKFVLLEVVSVSKRGPMMKQYEVAIIYALQSTIRIYFNADEALPQEIFTCQYVHKLKGFLTSMPPTVYNVVLYINDFKCIGMDDNIIKLSAMTFNPENKETPKDARTFLFGFLTPPLGFKDKASDVEEAMRLALLNVSLKMTDFQKPKVSNGGGAKKDHWAVHFKQLFADVDIDASQLYKLRSVPIVAPSGDALRFQLSGECCEALKLCKSCHKLGTCYCTAQGKGSGGKRSINDDGVGRRLAAKQNRLR